jgi:hypothetical protein
MIESKKILCPATKKMVLDKEKREKRASKKSRERKREQDNRILHSKTKGQ